MEQDAAEVKQTPQVGDQSQTAKESEIAELEPSDAKKLIQFIENNYEQHVANVQSFDEFYHAIFELIENFWEERGQLKYRIPEKEKIYQAYIKHTKSVKREEFDKICNDLIRPCNFTFGKATVNLFLFLFGAPLGVLAAKRALPGMGWMSDDVVIPLVTSGSVAYLVRTKKL